MNRRSVNGIDVKLSSSPQRPPPDADLGFGRVFTDHMLLWDYHTPTGWHRPRIVPYGPLSLDPSAMALHYGQAMFEGMKGFRGQDGRVRLFRPADHCRRMNQGAPRLCMPAPDPAKLLEAILALVSLDQAWVPSSPGTALYIRPTLIATEPALGVRAANSYTLFIILTPVSAYYSDGWKPLKIWVEEKYVRAAPGGIGHVKAGANYVGSLLASEDAKRRGYAQVLWLDAGGQKTFEEVGTMNLFVRLKDEVVTAPLEGTILNGITRDSVMVLLRGWGFRVSERRISLDEVRGAHRDGKLIEVFGTGTASVVAPVGELGLGGERLTVSGGQAGELSKRLFDAMTGIQYATQPDPHHWMVEVPRPSAPARTGTRPPAAPRKANPRSGGRRQRLAPRG